MKKLLVVLLLLSSNLCQAQTTQVDSLTFQVDSLKKEVLNSKVTMFSMGLHITEMHGQIDNIQLHLTNSHKEYQKGTAVFVIGTLLSLGGIGMLASRTETSTNSVTSVGYISIGVGGLMQLIGGIFWIDSHRHIGYAGGYNLPKQKKH